MIEGEASREGSRKLRVSRDWATGPHFLQVIDASIVPHNYLLCPAAVGGSQSDMHLFVLSFLKQNGLSFRKERNQPG